MQIKISKEQLKNKTYAQVDAFSLTEAQAKVLAKILYDKLKREDNQQ